MSLNLSDGRHETISSCIRCGRCTQLCNARKFTLNIPGRAQEKKEGNDSKLNSPKVHLEISPEKE
jgi:polyferredoxin